MDRFKSIFSSSNGAAYGALVLLAIGAVMYVYMPGFRGQLVFDDALLTRDHFVAMYGGWPRLQVRSLSYGSLVWVNQLVGEGWPVQRAINVLLHVANAALLFVFFRRLLHYFSIRTQRPEADGAATLPLLLGVVWFALAPVAVYGVAYLTQRSILMATMGTVLMMLSVLAAATTGRRRYWAAAVLAYVAAMLSKEYALMAPAIAWAIIVIVRRPQLTQLVRYSAVLAVVGAVAVSLVYERYQSLIGVAFDPASVSALKQLDSVVPGVEKNAWLLSILNQCALFFEYGSKWFFPLNQTMSIDMRPPFPTQVVHAPHLLLALLYLVLLAFSVVGVVRWRDWRGFLAFCLLIPTSLFFTELATVWIQDPFVLYRSYLWAIAVPGVLYLLFHRLQSSVVWLIAVGVLIFFPQTGADRVSSMATSFSAWDDAAKKLPDQLTTGQSRIFLNRGQARLAAGELTPALMDFRRSTLLGDQGEGLLNTGVVLLSLDRPAQALEALNGAAARGQAGAPLSYNRGLALARVGKLGDAVSSFTEALAQAPEAGIVGDIYAQRALAQVDLRKTEAALADAQRATSASPKLSAAYAALGFAQHALGDAPKAIAAFDESIRLEQSALALLGRAQAKASVGDRTALTDLDAAQGISPDDAKLVALRERVSAILKK